jgi:3-hydroxybutyryl-CoA dehydratase
MIELFKNMSLVTHQFVVTQEVYKAFQICSGDMNPLHTDLEFAKSKGFPECVMYGNIINAYKYVGSANRNIIYLLFNL